MSELSARWVAPTDAAVPSPRIIAAEAAPANFVAYIAHELRTPLATQRALLELALADRDTDTAAWRDIAGDLLDACAQQERLLDRCLALSRSQAGLDRRQDVDLALLSAEALRTTNFEGLPVRVRLEPALTAGDPGLIELLLGNLLVNAVRHNRPGGWIAVTTCKSRGCARFTIENTGDPIHADELAYLFEPFRQGPSPQQAVPNTPPATGVGLGLAVVTAVADAHGAHVTAAARLGGGLRVEVAFPAGTGLRDGRWSSRPIRKSMRHLPEA